MKIRSVIMAGACVAVLAACGGNQPQPSPTPAPSTTQKETVKPTEAAPPAPATRAVEPAKATDTPKPVAKPADQTSDLVKLGELNRGLDKLKSFRMVWTMGWEGKSSDGKPAKGQWDMLQEYVTASKDQHLKWTMTDSDPSKSGAMEMFNVGDTVYMLVTDAKTSTPSCVSVSSDDTKTRSSVVEPWSFFGELRDAKLVKKGERVNGILTDQYVVDAKSAGFGAFTSGTGDVWVAQDGGYVVKYTGKFEGKASFLAATVTEGATTWNYELKDVGQIGEIKPPATCAPPGAGVPIPTSATDKSSIMGMTSFKTTESAKAMLEFYKKELGALGYKPGSENAFGSVAQIEFAKDQDKLSLMISEDKGQTTVIITQAK